LKKLPGVGHKSAERFAFHLLIWRPSQLEEFAEIIKETPLKLIPCSVCGCLLDHDYIALTATPIEEALICFVYWHTLKMSLQQRKSKNIEVSTMF